MSESGHGATDDDSVGDDPTSDEIRKKADERFEAALEESGARDPRAFYREMLRELKEEGGSGESGGGGRAYAEALAHFSDVLIPGVASGELEPLRAWRDFGLMLAELTAEGRPIVIDETGVSHSFDAGEERGADRMILHLPDKGSVKALLVSLPKEPTRAQKATYDLLVAGKQSL